MPELPEVETVRRGLEPVLAGRILARVVQRRNDLRWPLPPSFADRLSGRRMLTVGRRSKWLLIGLDRAETWMVHLGMSGRLVVSANRMRAAAMPIVGSRGDAGAIVGGFVHAAGESAKHDHIAVTTDAGVTVTYNDARRFGAMDLWPTELLHAHPHLAGLGPEPVGNAFNGVALAAACAGRRSPIKAVLMDQRSVAGLGNIYVCEALHRAGIHPARMASTIGRRRMDRLVGEIVATLAEAIAAGGSSLRDYRRTDGELGYFQHAFRVYDRQDAPCQKRGCRGTVRRMVQSGRSTFYCPRCQR